MILSDKERAVIERMRGVERKKRGTVNCYDCGGSGGYSQSNCETCRGAGELKRNGPEIRVRVRYLEERKAHAVAAWDKLIAEAKEGPK